MKSNTASFSANKAEAPVKLLLIPGRLLVTISFLYLAAGSAAFFISVIFPVWAILGIMLFLFIVSDMALLLLLGDRLSAKREISHSLAQNEPEKVKLYINRQSRRDAKHPMLPSSISIYDLYPDSMSADIFPAKIDGAQRNTLTKSNTLVFEYSIMPNERGPWFFNGIQFLLGSPLRLWKLRATHKIESFGRTYPNFKQIARGTELKNKKEKGEIRKIRKRGLGMEFESLRDYQDGDSIRLIDWRASSRCACWTPGRSLNGRLKLIVKNYQEEQDQQVLFIIDSGYRLPDSHFDCALGAMLMLSYIALKHGDAVAASSFGARELWIPPRKGVKAYTGLMNGLYDLHSAPVASSPFLALENALGRLRRRSLIVLISNFREEDDRQLASIIPRIKKQHLLLMVSFRENEVEELANPAAPPKTREDLLQTAAALTYLTNRKRMYAKWEHSGLLVLETSPRQISTALINRYLSIKKSGRL